MESLLKISVEGMTCSSCSNSVEGTLKNLTGVTKATVSLLENVATISYLSSVTTPTAIIEAIDEIGFGATVILEEKAAVAPVKGQGELLTSQSQRPFTRIMLSIEGTYSYILTYKYFYSYKFLHTYTTTCTYQLHSFLLSFLAYLLTYLLTYTYKA